MGFWGANWLSLAGLQLQAEAEIREAVSYKVLRVWGRLL